LRVFLTFRLSFRLACFMGCIFSDRAYTKHTVEGLMQSFLKKRIFLT